MYHLFQAFGIELEYMVVDRATLAVRPIVDSLLRKAAAAPEAVVESEEVAGQADEVRLVAGEQGASISVGNELAAHVLEFKVASPAPSLVGLDERFHRAIESLNGLLASEGAMLLPTGMHPTMDPEREMVLWPHGNSEVYAAFNRIFDCRGHGWANLQASHINLPFATDGESGDEFGRLHGAIRVLLPIMPALTASSPMMEGRVTGIKDNRLEVYRRNSRKVPEAAGKVIPERAFTREEYDRLILQRIYKAFEAHDPAGVLRHEWCNSRGAIARFTRNAIEIRVLDVQECPKADLAIAALIVAVLRGMCEKGDEDQAAMQAWEVEPLHAILLDVIRNAEDAVITDSAYLRMLGISGSASRAGDVWKMLADRYVARDGAANEYGATIERLLRRGSLSGAIVRAAGEGATRDRIRAVYGELGRCLRGNTLFECG
jgi:gamma-glutamyl:cysteine ligase YbdK (ATP-grasp superfamily)